MLDDCLDCALDCCHTCAEINQEYYDGGCCCGHLRPDRDDDDEWEVSE